MAVNRFSRLVELRRLREEAQGGEYAKVLADLNALQQQVVDLDQETEQARVDALEMVGNAASILSGEMLTGFFEGQKIRRKRLLTQISRTKPVVEAAKQRWLEARKGLRQAEILEEKTSQQLQKEALKVENRMLDMAGVVRHIRQRDKENML
ncbi:flagellar export protein FliJ [Magnetococcus marinus MC-1]|uniref:Flagellar FliJ protein n=1 Tax=Magnetococcus marinus (strain ATCC BAA-1437 / JCM 17883 / MC-1) TaxID=156889 RepID=A0L3P3_MAGMM|nr:flagellar export protein FliJ [Magnetococcus marinus]ABK42586.1 flagellar export protein FliJ [Magnetococcus marinus MC-1]